MKKIQMITPPKIRHQKKETWNRCKHRKNDNQGIDNEQMRLKLRGKRKNDKRGNLEANTLALHFRLSSVRPA